MTADPSSSALTWQIELTTPFGGSLLWAERVDVGLCELDDIALELTLALEEVIGPQGLCATVCPH